VYTTVYTTVYTSCTLVGTYAADRCVSLLSFELIKLFANATAAESIDDLR